MHQNKNKHAFIFSKLCGCIFYERLEPSYYLSILSDQLNFLDASGEELSHFEMV